MALQVDLDPVTTQLHGEILYDEAAVNARINELGKAVVDRYQHEMLSPLFVCLLKGGQPFATKLMSAIVREQASFHPDLDTMQISTYSGRSAQESVIVRDIDPRIELKGRTVVLLDDLVDTGSTIAFAEQHFYGTHGAKVVDTVTLARRSNIESPKAFPSLVGFEIPNDDWLTGMGLDDKQVANEGNRWLPYIALANRLEPGEA